MTAIPELFNDLKARFSKDVAGALRLIFQFDITNGDSYYMVIDNGSLEIVKGSHNSPTITLILDTQTLNGIFSGSVDGTQAFMQNKIKAEGDIMMATKLFELFSH